MPQNGHAGAADLSAIEDLDWQARTAFYAFLVAEGRPPTIPELAATLHSSTERTELALRRLHQRHALFLEPAPGPIAVRMTHPFSMVPTQFRVTAAGRMFWANCAWDMLGIPAALHTDADIEAQFGDALDNPVTMRIRGGQLEAHGEVVHFPLPFRVWYDDLIRT